MEIIVIGKPAINTYLPLQEFPVEGDIFYINNKTESVGGVSATSACLLGKWGMSVHYTGVVGNDAYAEKIRDQFKTDRVQSKYLETNFETGTAGNYIILNTKTGFNTKVVYNDTAACLEKYKYDFIPDFALVDGTDPAGTFALMNTNGSVKILMYGRRGDKETISMCRRAAWNIVTENFVKGVIKGELEDSAEGLVDFYQRLVDATGLSNYIVILDNHKILYSEEGKVKILPEMKMLTTDVSSYDSVFVGTFGFAIFNGVSLDDSIKMAQTASSISLGKIGEVDSIPTVDEVLDNSGLREKLGLSGRRSVETPVQTQNEAAPQEGAGTVDTSVPPQQ